MSSSNPEIEAQLDSLAELCCDSIASDQAISDERVKQLSKALLMSGFEQKDGAPLSAQLDLKQAYAESDFGRFFGAATDRPARLAA